QISMKCDSLQALRSLHRRLQQEHARDIQPVTHGNAVSVYALDPEGNRLEFYLDLPWYVSQPVRVPVDLCLDDAALMAGLEQHVRSLAGFMPRAEWRRLMAQRMGVD
ncbi:MAG: glyoxalase, partial [Lautropia sp.]